MATSDLGERGVRAAVEVARDAGIGVDAPVVLSDVSNLIVHLAPAPVVARVSTATGTVRSGDAWFRREAAVAGFLAAAGAPVVAPSALLPAGPHERDGLLMTFWDHAREADAPLDPVAAGHALRECHEALTGYPGDLPELAPMREAEQNLERLIETRAIGDDDGELLRAVAADAIDRIERCELPQQAVHGDAHLGNVANTVDGPLWNDWEDAFRGPLAWDRACMHFSQQPGSADAARACFGDERIDDETLELFLAARRLQVTVWAGVVAPEVPQAREAFENQLARYRESAG
jgi:hypothetical protein